MRTNDGKRKKAEKGLLTHNPGLYGYGFDKETDTLYVIEDDAWVVRMMYHFDHREAQNQTHFTAKYLELKKKLLQ